MNRLLILLIICSSVVYQAIAQHNVDSLWATTDTISIDTQRIYKIRDLAYSLNHPPTSIALLERMKASDLHNNSAIDKAKVDVYLAEMYYLNGDFKIAKSLLNKCIEHWTTNSSPLRVGIMYYKLADIYTMESNHEKTAEYAIKSIEYFQSISDTSWIIKSSIKLASTLEKAGQKEKAIDQFHALRSLSKNDPTSLSSVYNGLAVIYNSAEEIDSALHYQILFRDAIVGTNHMANLFIANYNLGQSYQKLGKLKEAENTFDQCVEYANKSGIPMLLPYAQISKGSLLIGKNKSRQALRLLDAAEKSKLLPDQQQLLAEARYKAYKNLGEMSLALPYLERWKILSDSLKDAEISNRINELQIRNETVKNENEINKLSLENTIKDEKAQIQRMKIFGLSIGLALLGGLLYYTFRQSNKITHQNKIITSALADKDVLLKEIHHRVKNNLQMISSLLSLQSRTIDNEMASVALEDGQNRVQSMALIHQHLYTQENITAVRMPKYLANLCQTVFDAHNINREKVHLVVEIDEIELDISTVVPLGLIYNELLTNACKYAFPDGKSGMITVLLHEKANLLIASVSDNGQGLSSKETRVGFGTKLINTFSKKLQAEVIVDTEKGYSTQLRIKHFTKM